MQSELREISDNYSKKGMPRNLSILRGVRNFMEDVNNFSFYTPCILSFFLRTHSGEISGIARERDLDLREEAGWGG